MEYPCYDLSDEEIEFIRKDVKKCEISFSHLEEELIDHLCCMVEYLLTEGFTFNETYKKVRKNVAFDSLKDIEIQTLLLINKKLIKDYRIIYELEADGMRLEKEISQYRNFMLDNAASLPNLKTFLEQGIQFEKHDLHNYPTILYNNFNKLICDVKIAEYEILNRMLLFDKGGKQTPFFDSTYS